MNKVSRNERKSIFFNSTLLKKKSNIKSCNHENKFNKKYFNEKKLIISHKIKDNNYTKNNTKFDINFLLLIIFYIINSFFLH
jgi:hypothetical protein